ncbi:MAG TPA: hypothetical protein VGS20_13575 [Candidatus Acidoferrales bacterium]|nr:hypothetical protein [Candidatus Acidoferrales bacterium]
MPEAGDIVGDFELKDSTGATRRLGDLTAGGRLLLIFYRGAW